MNIPLDKWSGSDATRELQTTIAEFQEASGKQTRHMIGLTWVIAALTLVMLLAVFVQIYLAWSKT
jgi:hypothetical protein